MTSKKLQPETILRELLADSGIPALTRLVAQIPSDKEGMRSGKRWAEEGQKESVLTFRLALRQWYEMNSREADANPPTTEETKALLSEIRKLWDEAAGLEHAGRIYGEEKRAYYVQTGRCPTCGQHGIFHELPIEVSHL